VNPGRLDHAERDSVCNQCHLHGEIRIRRAGKQLEDFRPGMRLDDVLAVFVQPAPPSEAGSLRAVSQVEQMAFSACYRESGGSLGCISCHDPHSTPPPGQRDGFFSKRCLACHGERGCSLPAAERHAAPANDSCIHCHMPASSAGGIPHTAQTDHRILRRPAQPATQAAVDLAKMTIFGDAGARIPDWEQSRARGIMLLELGSRRNDRAAIARQAEALLTSALAQTSDDTAVLHFLGTACVRQGRPRDARDYWERALKVEPDRIETLLAHAVVCEALGEWDKSARSFERLEQLSPWQADALALYAGLLHKRKDWESVIRVAERALEINPTQLETRRVLAEAYSNLGRHAESFRHAEILTKMVWATSN
jgi:predicted CXXCH cytochrome family protein